MALLMTGGMIFASTVNMAARIADDDDGDGDDGNDGNAISAVPENVTQLTGKAIDYASYKQYVTTGRPEDRSKMFLLYNVGTGKFLNVGSYWGTQAVVSDVPRPFWLQRRNEKKVSNQWSYLRYPESTTDNAGWFYNDFFNLTTMQVGNTQGNLRAHATYKYIRMVDIATGQTVISLDAEKYSGEFTCDGTSFKSQFSNVDFSKYRIEAQFDMSECTATESGDGKMETLLSFGENVDYWSQNGVFQNNLHIYGFRQNGKSYLRVQAMEKNGYNDKINKTGDEAHPINVGDDNLVTVVIGWQSVLVNGVQCMPRNALPYESAITPLLGLEKLYVGSAQGKTRTKAVYKSVTLNKPSVYDDDPTHVVRADLVCNGRAFFKEYEGSLYEKEVYADIDLSTCKNEPDGNGKAKDENILSIGTDIANWYTKDDDTSQNLHIYYNNGNVYVAGVSNSHTDSGDKPAVRATVAATGSVKIKLNRNGLYINGSLVPGFDAANDIIKYLVSSAGKIQVGSKQGDGRSYATYRLLTLVAESVNVVEPGFKGYGNTKFCKSYLDNLKDKIIEADIDLSNCKEANENVLSIGTDVSVWGYDGGKGYTAYNIHLYYTASNGLLEISAPAEGNKFRYMVNLSGAKNLHVTLSADGLVVNDVQYFSPNNEIVAYLIDKAEAIEVGSEQGDKHVNYATYNYLTVKKLSDADTYHHDVVLAEGTQCNGMPFGKTYLGTLADKVITAKIDLSTCTGTKENVLSIGNVISQWGAKEVDAANGAAANIHFYYTANDANGVMYQMASKTLGTQSAAKYITVGDDHILTVEWKDGELTANGTRIDDWNNGSSTFAGVIDYLKNNAAEIQVGSREGTNRSHATYNTLTVTSTTAATSTTARPLRAQSASVVSGEVSVTKVFEDKACDGQAVLSDQLTLSFADGDYIEADIDLSHCDTEYENVFSIGTDITKWGNESADLHNIHFYWLKKTTDGKHLLQVVYVNKDHSDDTKRAVYVADGELLHINLSNDGLFVGGTNIYPSLSPMPQLAYDASKAGDIVRIKQDSYGNRLLDENGRYIIDDAGHGVYVTNNGYIYTEESRTDKSMPLFITSRFNQESTASGNEDVYFSWAPFLKNNDKWGTVGVFADRALPQKEVGTENSIKCSQWYFEPVSTADGNYVYRIYLNMKDVQVPQRKATDPGKYEFMTQSGKFYLQATTDQVYGNNLENYGGGYDDGTATDITAVKAIQESVAPTDAKSYWKVFDMNEYYRLFEATNSEMSKMLDLSFLLSDPNFDRESSLLSKWTMDDNMKDASKNLKVRIGYDHYSKKTLDDTDYTDNEGKKTTTGNNQIKGSKQFDEVKTRTNNHGRYMGVDVSGDGHGLMWQDVELEYPGWYAVSCSGLTTAGAKLFVQTVQDNNVISEAITQPLHALTKDELSWLKGTKHSWPYDQVTYNSSDAADAMPMYNALVVMNDDYVPNGRPSGLSMDGLKAQVSYFVDPELVAGGKKVKIRFGVSIPDAAAGTQTQSDDDASASTMEPWTVFDNFHLMFGGLSQEPNLVLDEDSTTLDYLDKANHQFSSRPMRLKRTVSDGKWNTIILPVNLTKSQLQYMFGENVKLAKLNHLTDNTIEFVSETEAADGEGSIYLRAFKPYIMYVSDKDTKKGVKDEEYVAEYYDRTDGGKTSYQVKAPKGHYYVEGVTLQGVQSDSNNQPYYNFRSGTSSVVYTDGLPSYTYADNVVATNTVNSSDTRTLQAYGTLCKNFSGSAIIEGRSDLSGAYVFQNSNMYKIKNQYGTKGLRCWFVPGVNDKPISALAKVMIDGIEDTATSISDVYDDGTPVAKRFADGVYTIDGRLLRSGNSTAGLPAGLYIVGGQKVVVK